MNERMIILPAGLDEADTRIRIFRQARRENASRRSSAHNHIIKSVRHHLIPQLNPII
jgi:hypothetical protein